MAEEAKKDPLSFTDVKKWTPKGRVVISWM